MFRIHLQTAEANFECNVHFLSQAEAWWSAPIIETFKQLLVATAQALTFNHCEELALPCPPS